MAKKNELYCTFFINDIQEVSFFYNVDYDCSGLDVNDIQVGMKHSIKIDNEKNIVGVHLGIIYLTSEDNVKLLEYSMNINFRIPELKNIITEEDNSIVVKDENIILNLLNISVGTLRGALFLKTKNTGLERFPLPVIPSSLLSKSINK